MALIAQMFKAFGMDPKGGGSNPPQVETFSVSKILTLCKNIRSYVENECCCPRTVNISNVNFILKNIYTAKYSTLKNGTANVWP